MARTKTFDPNEVLDRATELFWEQGYEATSMQDLVDHLGLSRSSLYDTFGGKHALYLAALDRYRQAGALGLRSVLDEEASAKAALRRTFEAVVEESVCDERRRGCFMANATVERASCDPETDWRALESFEGMQAAFQETVERAQAQGEIAADRDAEALGRFLVNAYWGLRVVAKANPTREVLQDIVAETLATLEQNQAT